MELRQAGQAEEIQTALTAAFRKSGATQAELAAVTSAWSKQNPGKTSMEFGGPETQKLYEQVAALPPSASISRADKYTCDYCNKSSTEKLMICSRCRNVAYCNRDCQSAAWLGHKKVCKKVSAEGEEKVKLPLTWAQLEAFGGGVTAEGKVSVCIVFCVRLWFVNLCLNSNTGVQWYNTQLILTILHTLFIKNTIQTLEVRIMNITTFGREVLDCKDRTGAVLRIAAYSDSHTLPGAASGRVLRWKNPRFRYFMDGSSGGRIEEADMCNVTITDN